ncbi:MAG: response regulator, partial [Candidatus Omnitrophota bacterium]|nr:response regulator [Candidatus Omnitrophota bacterium]
AQKEKPDLIILDLMLPKLDGYTVCRLLKFDEKYKQIPIMLFSARTQQADMDLGKEVGADAYLTKPFEASIFLAKVSELLKK